MAKKSNKVYVAYKLDFKPGCEIEVKMGPDAILGAYGSEETAVAAVIAEYKENGLNKYSYSVKNIVELELQK